MANPTFSWPAQLAARTQQIKPSAIREILALTQTGDVISFAGGLPAPNLFPVNEIEAASARVLDTYGPAALQYSTTEGHRPLREWIAARFSCATADDVQIVSGSQQGLDLVAKCLLDPGDKVAIAAPTYPGAIRALEPYEVTFEEIAVDEDGLLPNSLEAAFSRGTKLLYVIPNFDNPTGVTVSLSRRHEIIGLARKYGIAIVEDDPYGDLRFQGDELPRLYDLAPDHVIHIGTFSKILVPGFRVAWLLAADEVMAPIRLAKQAVDLHTSTFVQMIAHEVTQSGYLEPHLADAREYYRRQRDSMLAAMNRHFPEELRWTTPAGGMFLWVIGPESLNTSTAAYDAIDAGVVYVPGQAFFADEQPRNSFRLSYSVATATQIEDGIATLGKVLTTAMP